MRLLYRSLSSIHCDVTFVLIFIRACDEAEILLYINHENVVRCHGVVMWPNYFGVLMDYISGGSLLDLLHKDPRPVIPWKLKLRMIHELAKALAYLHNSGLDQRVVHGDLRPSNILVTSDLHIKVSDFGAAAIATMTSDRSAQHTVSEPNAPPALQYIAPELFTAMYQGRSTAMDVYR